VVAKSAGDGYTLLFANNGQAALPHLQKIDWDAVKDFKPVSSVATYAMLILVNGQSPYKTVAELVAAAKSQPGKLAYGSSGPGGPLHLGMEMFKSAAGIDIFHVPYKGNAPMNVALLSGEIPIAMDTLAISLPHIKANKYKALAVTSTKRLSLIPEVPTLAEAGLPGFDYEGWQGIFVPASTPSAVVTQLNAALVKVLAQPALRQRLIDLGYEPKSSSAAEMGATLAKDLNAYRKVITDAKIKVD